MTLTEAFVLLQVLDFMTTLLGLWLGGTELNPFIARLMRFTDPVIGLMLAKLIGFGLGGYFIWRERTWIVRRINYFFAVLVSWNMVNIITTFH